MSKTTKILISNIKWNEDKQDTSHLPKTFEVELDEDDDIQEEAADVLMEKFDVRPWSFEWERVNETQAIQETHRG